MVVPWWYTTVLLGQNSIEHDSDLLLHILVALCTHRPTHRLRTQATRTHKIGNDICVALPVRRLCRQSSMNSRWVRLIGRWQRERERGERKGANWGCRICCVCTLFKRELEKRYRRAALKHKDPGKPRSVQRRYIELWERERERELWSAIAKGFEAFPFTLSRSSTSCSICAVNYGAHGFLREIFHILPSFFTMFLCHSNFCLTLRF